VGIEITALGAEESVMNTDDEKNAGTPADDSVDRSIELGMCKRDDGTTEVTIMGDASDMGLFGIKNRDFFHGLVRQIANAGANGKYPDELGVRSMLDFIIEGKPTDAAGISMANHKRNTGPMLGSPRCGAKTRLGKPCMSPAVRGKKRCRMHGGAAGSGARPGNKNALKHGRYSSEAFA